MNIKELDERIRDRVVELWLHEDPPETLKTWQWVADTINKEFYHWLKMHPNGAKSKTAVRKIYGRHIKGHKNRPVPTITKETKAYVPRDKVHLPAAETILIIGDTHIPFVHEGYMEFLLRMRDKYLPDTIIHIGDVVDFHAISFWDSDPDGHSQKDELDMAKEGLRDWVREFPKLKICVGNHDLRPMRKLFKAGVPAEMLKSMNEILETPSTWSWEKSYICNGTRFEHGKTGGIHAVFNRAVALGSSVVMGHTHTTPGVRWISNNGKSWYGLNVGCGIDLDAYAFRYSDASKYEPTLGCGLVLDYGSLPMFIPFLE